MMETRIRYGDPTASRSRSFRLVVPPRARYGAAVRAQLADFAHSLGIPAHDICEFLLAVGEALANAFEHSMSDAKIEITCWLVVPDQLIATIVDRGIGFGVPVAAKAQPKLPDPASERGRGFAIMRRCTDHVAVRSVPGQGTAVILMRYVRLPDAGTNYEHAQTG